MPFGGKEKMAPKPDHKLYQYHASNLRSIEVAIKNTALSARKAISEQNIKAVESFIRLFSFLIGAWAETRLLKLLYEPTGISVDDREVVLSQPQIERWHKTTEIAFRRKYAVSRAGLSRTTLSHTAYTRYTTITEILNSDLRLIIEVRNKLAHGQWVYPLNNEGNDVESDKFRILQQENLLSLQFKKELLTNISLIVNDLLVSLQTFERDFDRHYRQFMTTKTNLQKRSYEKYAQMMIAKRLRGIEKRRHNQ